MTWWKVVNMDPNERSWGWEQIYTAIDMRFILRSLEWPSEKWYMICFQISRSSTSLTVSKARIWVSSVHPKQPWWSMKRFLRRLESFSPPLRIVSRHVRNSHRHVQTPRWGDGKSIKYCQNLSNNILPNLLKISQRWTSCKLFGTCWKGTIWKAASSFGHCNLTTCTTLTKSLYWGVFADLWRGCSTTAWPTVTNTSWSLRRDIPRHTANNKMAVPTQKRFFKNGCSEIAIYYGNSLNIVISLMLNVVSTCVRDPFHGKGYYYTIKFQERWKYLNKLDCF